MNEKLVSVVITTYGRAGDLILEAINSVRNQTYKNIEIIVIDDNGIGTEAQSANMELFVNEADIKYLPNKKNYGAQVSRNLGILCSKGEYIAFLDDDDIWMPQKIEKQVAIMEIENYALVYCNGYRFYDDDVNKKILYQYNFVVDRDIDFITELRSDHIGSTSNPLMRRECLARTGLFDVEMPARQDYEMWLRFCKYYRVKGIDEPLFYYRYHSGGRITKSLDKEIKSYQLLWKKYKNDYKRDRVARSNLFFLLCRSHFKARRFIKALYFGIRAFFSCPTRVVNIIASYKMNKAQF